MKKYSAAKRFISECMNADILYDGVREALDNGSGEYPTDCQIKELQRLADAKYEELKRVVDLSVVETLSDAALEAAYRKRQMQYLIQDAKNHTENYLEDMLETTGRELPDIPEIIYESMAEEFLDRKDCNCPDNDVWYGIVKDYCEDSAYISLFPEEVRAKMQIVAELLKPDNSWLADGWQKNHFKED